MKAIVDRRATRMSSGQTPLGSVARGLLAGAAGTAAMTAAQTAMMKLRGADSSGVPGEIAKRVIEGVYQGQVPEARVELLNNAMHWAYGTGLGIVYGLAQGTLHARTVRHGLAFGALVWGASLLQLPAMRLAPPVWEHPPQELAVDVGSHVVYGLGAAGAYAAASG